MISQFYLFFAALVVSLLVTFPALWGIRIFKLSQSIREEGPESHLAKAGTPTMGGIGFVLTIIAFGLIFIDFDLDPRYFALILLTFAFAAIGFVDDLLKIVRRQNLGLTFWQKILSQAMFALVFVFFLQYIQNSFSLFYLLFSTFVIIGSANATNLTDGLNGLLAGCGGIAFLGLAIMANRLGFINAGIFSLVGAGSILAFLYFNFPKAKVFMGDVGSLAMGAALAGLVVIMKQELLLIVIGGVFVIEALSVIIQVASFKLFKRRVFKMSPLHHHFELMGIPETKVVVGFWGLAVVLGIIGVLIM
ncbi:MAG: phospho-N-acetylmuramoyl-pentapeptide-transferase [bacterium]|nr:phospho-N-acetylmuramoyl-pentapeptide-transferase [Candidatus Margulisiibacteriota bacterium]